MAKKKKTHLKLIARQLAADSLKQLEFGNLRAHPFGLGVIGVAAKNASEFLDFCGKTAWFGLLAPFEIFTHSLHLLHVCCNQSIANTGRQRDGGCLPEADREVIALNVPQVKRTHPLAMLGRPSGSSQIKRRRPAPSQGGKDA